MEIIGAAEIATILGVSRQRADQLVRQKGFPDAIEELTAGRIWSAQAVMGWAVSGKRWPALAELYRELAGVAEHWAVEVANHAPAGDAMKRTLRVSERAVLVLKIQFGTDIDTRNAPLWVAQERIDQALVDKDAKSIVRFACEAAEAAQERLASGPSAPTIDVDEGFCPDDPDRPSTWLRLSSAP